MAKFVIAHPDQWIKGRLVKVPRPIPEDALPVALAQGWILLGRDSDVYAAPSKVNVQRNPNRTGDAGEDA